MELIRNWVTEMGPGGAQVLALAAESLRANGSWSRLSRWSTPIAASVQRRLT